MFFISGCLFGGFIGMRKDISNLLLFVMFLLILIWMIAGGASLRSGGTQAQISSFFGGFVA